MFVDIFLYVDTTATPTSAASTKQIGRRRVFVANPIGGQQALASWSLAVIDVEPVLPTPLFYTYRVAAQLVGYSTTAGVLVSGGAADSNSYRRGTLTAVLINK
jgi:hypothetical protein